MWSFDNAHFLMQIVLFIIISFVLCVECTVHSDGTPAIAQVSIIPDIDNFQRQRGGHRIIAATIPTPCGINMNLHLWGETKDIIELCRKFGIGPQPLQYPQPLNYEPDQYSYPPNHQYHSQQPQYEQYPQPLYFAHDQYSYPPNHAYRSQQPQYEQHQQPLRSVHDQYSYNPDHPQQSQQQQAPQQPQYEQEIHRLQQEKKRLEHELADNIQKVEQCEREVTLSRGHPHSEPADIENDDNAVLTSISEKIQSCISYLAGVQTPAAAHLEPIKREMGSILDSIGRILGDGDHRLTDGTTQKLREVTQVIAGCLPRLNGDGEQFREVTEELEQLNANIDTTFQRHIGSDDTIPAQINLCIESLQDVVRERQHIAPAGELYKMKAKLMEIEGILRDILNRMREDAVTEEGEDQEMQSVIERCLRELEDVKRALADHDKPATRAEASDALRQYKGRIHQVIRDLELLNVEEEE